MIKVTINGADYTAPQSQEELDYQTFTRISLCNQSSDLDLFCAIVGVDKELLKNSDLDFAMYLDMLLNFGDFTSEKFDLENITLPSILAFDNKNYAPKKDLGKMPFGLYADIKVLLQTKNLKDTKEYLEVCEEITAYYMQVLTTQKYDYESALQLLPKVRKMNFRSVLAVGVFFLMNFAELMSGTLHKLQKSVLQTNKRKQGIWNCLKNTACFWQLKN